MFTEIHLKLMALSCLRVISIQNIAEAIWSENEEIGLKHVIELEKNVDGLKIITESLGIETEKQDFFTGLKEITTKIPFSIYIENCLEKDILSEKISDMYGPEAGLIFTLSQVLNIVRVISSGLPYIDLRKTPKHRRKYIKGERETGIDFIKQTAEFLNDNQELIPDVFGEKRLYELKELMKVISQNPTSFQWARNVNNATYSIVNSLFPNFGEINTNIKRSEKLIHELRQCSTGKESWRLYETICTKILYFLFVPPMKRIVLQARSSSNMERRDAIIPIQRYDGFWNVIRQEYNCRNIVCEFKNNSQKLTKSAISQLRIYLSKPTIGKFGLLFTRKIPSKSLIQARRDAYEQEKMLILILDDEKLIKFLKSRAYLLNSENFLEQEKTHFEISY
jgi:hypothetical protein